MEIETRLDFLPLDISKFKKKRKKQSLKKKKDWNSKILKKIKIEDKSRRVLKYKNYRNRER